MMMLKVLGLLMLAHIYFTNAVPHRFVEPIESSFKPKFFRGSVEFIPSDDMMKSDLKVAPIGADSDGEKQFSRAAVESIPKTIVSYYQPLRSAVEHNPLYDEDYADEYFSYSGSRHARFLNIVAPNRPRFSKALNLEAYIVPNSPYDNDPYYYRSGSPYQELIDAQTYDQYQMARFEQGSENNRMKQSGKSKSKVVFCDITNWSAYRTAEARYVPENLDMRYCTHVIYAYATLDPESYTMMEFDSWLDIESNQYIRTVKQANGKPVFLAIGGWTDSAGKKYSELLSDKKLRSRFIENAIAFLKRFSFQGLHIDINYPACPQSDCKHGEPNDKRNFALFIQELRKSFSQSNLLVSVSISGYKEIIEVAYDFPMISKNVDFIQVMAYDYHGAWEQVTGHVSPLRASENDQYKQYNMEYALELIVGLGADKEKIVVGVPFYGQSFTLSSKEQGFNAPASGPGAPGQYTLQPGMLAYNEICLLLRKPGFKKGVDPNGNSGPYVTDGKIWAGYDDQASIMKKAKYVIDNGFAGMYAWTADLDDFNNNCCLESYPLLKAINRGLNLLNTPIPKGNDCTKPNVVTPKPPVMQTTVDSGQAGIPGQTTASSYKPESSTTSPWWVQSTSKSTTTSTRKTTSRTQRPPTTSQKPYVTSQRPPAPSTIPSPVNVQPVYVEDQASGCTSGTYKADPTSCKQYLVCSNNRWIVQPCPAGLQWSAKNMICDWPMNAKCEVKPANDPVKPVTSTTSRSTTRQRTTTTERTTTARRTTQRSTSASTTTRRPISTTTRRIVTTTRQPTTYFDTTTYYTTTYVVPQTTRPTKRPTRKPGKKPTKCVNGEYLPHKECNKYYICNNNRKVPMECADGLQFSTAINTCDHPYNVKCVSKKKYLKLLQREYKKSGVYTAALLRAAEGDPCDGIKFLPYPGKCSSYLQCLHSRLIESTCADGLVWNPVISTCDRTGCTQSDEASNEIDEYDEYEDEDVDNALNSGVDNSFIPSSTSTTTKAPPSQDSPPVTSLQTIPVPEYVDPLSGKYKLVCYFTNWAWYRPGDGKYLPDNIEPNLCTHIVYGFAVLNYDELTIRTHDSWADIDNRFYERVVEQQKRGVKVTLAIGGWNDSAGDKYSRLVRNPAARDKFIRHVIEFIEKYNFDGLDLDWEYPVCWQVDCKKGYPDEKEHFATFVEEISREFKPRNLLLSAAVSPSKTVIDAGYDVAKVAKYLDWVAVMTYDFFGNWDKKTGHVAPLSSHPELGVEFFYAKYAIEYWLKLGAPKDKIVMGMPLYGQSFTLADPKKHGLNAKASGPGLAGEFTRAAGFLAYYEICERIFKRGWKVVKDPQNRMGPYAYSGNQWVSFDDQDILRKKVQYIKDLGIAGGMIWALDLDDFRGKCGQGKHPLLKIIHQEFEKSSESEYDEPEENEEVPETNEETPEVNEETPEVNVIVPEKPVDEGNNGVPDESDEYDDEEETSNEVDEYEGDYKVVCYFTNWAWYRPGNGKYLPEDIDGDLCTHIIYGFAVLNRDTLTIQSHDPWADFDNKFYERVVAYKLKGIKVSLAIGGWNDSAGDKYSKLVRNPQARERFVKTIIEFIEKYGFDGLDLDWEYPVCWQVECDKGMADEKKNFIKLVEELSAEFKPRGLLLSSAVSPSKRVIDAGYDVVPLSKYLDWIAVMCYDYNGHWNKRTGHVAPMYLHPDDHEPTFNTNFTINYWIEKGADPRKLVLGMPMYGQSFSLAERSDTGLNSPTYGGGEAGEETRARGFLSYYEICTRIQKNKWTVVRDIKGRMGPYAYSGDQWVSFDDSSMIRHKSEYVKALGLGGAMIWATDLDDFRNLCNCEEYPLLRTINRVLRNYPGPHNDCLSGTRTQKPTAEATTRKPVTQKPTTQRTTQKPRSTTRTTTTTQKPFYEGEEEEAVDENEYDLDDGKSCNGKNFIQHDTECNMYYICNHGKPEIQSCPPALHWNAQHHYCDWPMNANCANKDHVEPVEVEEDEDTNEIEPASSQKPVTTRKTTTTKRPTAAPTPPRPTKPPVETDPFIPTGNNDFMVVCYFTNWAWYRPGAGKYKPSDIDLNLCTHIVYGFAVLNGETLTIKTHDSWADIDNNFYTQVSSLKKKGIKVLVAIGGWNDSLGNKYSRLVLNPQARARFTTNVIEFMKKYDFQGLDLDWEYPVCWQVDCTKGKPEEKAAFAEWVKELSEAFKPHGYLLSAAVSPSKKVIDAGYDIPKISKYMDWIAVMCYDFFGHWDKKTGHVAPLFDHPELSEKTFTAKYAIEYWIEKGAPPKKLVMGMPMYGQSFTLENPKNNGLNAIAPGPGQAGEFTRAAGFLAFYEICYNVNNGGWTVVRDPEGRIGPYAYKGRQWVSYDDVDTIERKTRFVKEKGLGGAMIWALDLDDFRNRCGCGTHPLLSTINLELGRISTSRLSSCT